QVVDGITCRRTVAAKGSASPGARGQLGTILATRAHAARVLRDQAIDVVHAHSPCLNGLAGLGHGRPLLYEVRSSWEDAAVSIGATTEGSLRYRASRALETYVVRRADEIVVISAGLRDDLIARGVPPERITIVPNALPAKMFALP